MSQTPSQPEEKTPSESVQANSAAPAAETASTAAAPEGRNDNLAFTNPDEYKHKHGEHKHGEHKHHHHHHHHHHRHFHPFDLSYSGIRDNLKLLFKTIYAYPYILLFLSLIFLFIMNSGLVLSQLNAHKSSFPSAETFYRWQEFLVMNKTFIVRIPFQITLVATIGIVAFLMQRQERHWQRNVQKSLPALIAAAIFSFAFGSARPAEEFERSACRDCLRNYHAICMKFANRHNGAFPKKLPNKSSSAAYYSSDHFVYHGAGKTIKDEAFILVEDKKNNHVGNYRYAIRSDGVMLISKYGGLYEEYINERMSAPVQDPSEEEEEEDFDWDENLDTFLTSTENDQITKVEGTIEERSILPDPRSSDYPNCRFTAHFIGNSILSGQPCPKEINLIIEGFADYAILSNNNVKNGDRVLCTLIPFDKLPEDEQSTQQADDLELFLLDSYYAVDMKIINSFTDDGIIPLSGILFSDGNDDYISIFDRHINPPVSETLKTAQNTSIRNDLNKMNSLLDGYDEARFKEVSKSFAEAWKKEQDKDDPGRNRIGNYVWRNVDNSFWTLPQNYSPFLYKPDELSQDILNCFSSLKKVLEENGVQLIVSLVPDKDVISARVINKQFRNIPDIQTATYVKQLSETGIETIYASDSIIRNYNKYPFAFFYPSNPHPSDTAQDVLSDLLAERLKRYNIPANLRSQLFSETQSAHTYKDQEEYLFPKNCDIGNNKEGRSYTCRQILYNKEFVSRSKESPVIVIGNSFIETPVSPPDSLPVLLSYKLCAGIDWYRISGYGPFSDIMVRLLTNPDALLKGKKVLIMQVGTFHLNYVNHNETMLDIARLDNERLLLNGKQMKTHFLLSSNVNKDVVEDEELWGPLSNLEKTVLKIGKSGELEFTFDLEQSGKILDTKPIICFIPHLCVKNSSCKLIVNGQQKTMNAPNYASNAKFFNLAFELPAGTKEITIKATGKADSLFAVKDIQIWQ